MEGGGGGGKRGREGERERCKRWEVQKRSISHHTTAWWSADAQFLGTAGACISGISTDDLYQIN